MGIRSARTLKTTSRRGEMDDRALCHFARRRGIRGGGILQIVPCDDIDLFLRSTYVPPLPWSEWHWVWAEVVRSEHTEITST